jgi:hypothetical protein
MWAHFTWLELDKEVDVAFRRILATCEGTEDGNFLNVGTEQRPNFFSKIGETVH